MLAAVRGFLNTIYNNPVTDLKFLFPILMLLFASYALRLHAKRVKIDGPPTLSQKIEPFETPNDRFNTEVRRIMSDNYDYYVKQVETQINRVEEIKKEFLRARKMYERSKRQMAGLNEKKKARAKERRKEIFNQILGIAKELSSEKYAPIIYEEAKQ